MNTAAERASKPIIVMFAYHFDPAKAIGAVRPWRFYTYLREMGYDCRVIAATAPDDAPPEGVTVIPDVMEEFWQRRLAALRADTPMEPISTSAHIDRALRWVFFPGQLGFSWSQQAAKAATRIIGKQRAVILSTSPPIGTVFAGYLAKRATGAPWIADFRDPIRAPWNSMFPPASKLSLIALEKAALHASDTVVANTAAAADEWRRSRRVAPKIHVIWNGFDPESQLAALPVPDRDYRMIVHAGSLYGGRNANSVLRAAERLIARREPGLPNFKIVQFGDIVFSALADQALQESAIQQGWFEIRPRLPKPDAMRAMCEADGSLLLQPQSRIQVPAKVFEYISIGRPILAVAPRDSSTEWILSRSGIPYRCIHPDDEAAVAAVKIREFLQLPTTPVTPSKEYLRDFDARRQTAHLVQLIEESASR